MRSSFCLIILLAGCSGEMPGRATQPQAALTAAPGLHEIVQRLTARGPEAMQMTQRPDGMRIYKVQQGMSQVIVAKTQADGTVQAKCVESAEDGFLPDARQ